MLPDGVINDVFNDLEWEDMDVMELDKAVEGLTVIGGEPIGCPPYTDGTIIYLRQPNGDVMVLEISAFDSVKWENAFCMRSATIPAAAFHAIGSRSPQNAS